MNIRRIESHEKRLIDLILAELGDDKISVSDSAMVQEIDADGSIKFVSQHDRSPQRLLPVEAQILDADGVPVHALLHVVNNTIDELEIYKDDGSRIASKPRPEEWTILNLGDRTDGAI